MENLVQTCDFESLGNFQKGKIYVFDPRLVAESYAALSIMRVFCQGGNIYLVSQVI